MAQNGCNTHLKGLSSPVKGLGGSHCLKVLVDHRVIEANRRWWLQDVNSGPSDLGLNGRQVRLVGSRDLKAVIAFSLAAREQPVLLASKVKPFRLWQGARRHSSGATPDSIEVSIRSVH